MSRSSKRSADELKPSLPPLELPRYTVFVAFAVVDATPHTASELLQLPRQEIIPYWSSSFLQRTKEEQVFGGPVRAAINGDPQTTATDDFTANAALRL